MKKQSGPFKLKYKKSAFPFSENFHTKKHGKFKIVKEDESKKITPGGVVGKIGSGLEETGMIKAVKSITTTKPKSQILDLPKTSGKRAQQRGKISSPPPKKQPEKLPEFMKKPFDSGISIYGNPKSSRSSKKSSRPSKKRARRRGAAGTGFFRF